MAKTKGKNAKQRNTNRELGTPGYRVSSGVITEEFVPDLRWPESNNVYKEMTLNDATIGSILFAIETTIKQVPVDVKYNGDAVGALFLKQCIGDMDKTLDQVFEDALTFLSYGYAPLEIVYKQRVGPTNSNKYRRSKYNDSLWGWKRLPLRAQDTVERWVFPGDEVDDNGNIVTSGPTTDTTEIKGLLQRPPNFFKRVYIPEEKFLLFRNNTKKDNPESTSMLRTAYRSWYIKKNLEDVEAIGVERTNVQIPVIKIPAEFMADDADAETKQIYQSFKDLGANLRNNTQAAAVIPSDRDETGNPRFELGFEGGPNRPGAQDVNKIIERYDAAILAAVLADFLRLGQKSAGSGALGTQKLKLFKSAISSWLTGIIDVFNKEAIPRLWIMNGWEPDETMPTLKHGNISEASIEELADYLDKMVERSVIQPDEDLESYARERFNLPEKAEMRPTTEERIQESKNQSTKEVAQIQQTANQGDNNDEGSDEGTNTPPSN